MMFSTRDVYLILLKIEMIIKNMQSVKGKFLNIKRLEKDGCCDFRNIELSSIIRFRIKKMLNVCADKLSALTRKNGL